jgi:hypothetical protein
VAVSIERLWVYVEVQWALGIQGSGVPGEA